MLILPKINENMGITNMYITESIIGFAYPQKIKIRQLALSLEDKLKDFMTLPLQILAVPEDAPPEIPRAIGNSRGGHSVLTVTQVNSNFRTLYDGEFTNDWNLVRNYLNEKITLLFPFINEICNNEIFNFGIILKVVFDSEVGKTTDRIAQTIIKSSNLVSNMEELSVKVTFYHKDTFYVNFVIETIKKYDLIFSPKRSDIQYMSKKPSSETLQFTIDVNDRYIANFSEDYFSKQGTGEEILGVISEIIENRLDKIYHKGDWS
jgi:hypothetical protein